MELLSRLQKVASEYARREEQLTKELGKARHGSGQQHRRDLEQIEAEASEKEAALETFFTSEQERFQAVHERRRAWIHRAHTACIKQVLAKARQVKEREIGDLQVRHLQAQRSLPLKL